MKVQVNLGEMTGKMCWRGVVYLSNMPYANPFPLEEKRNGC